MLQREKERERDLRTITLATQFPIIVRISKKESLTQVKYPLISTFRRNQIRVIKERSESSDNYG